MMKTTQEKIEEIKTNGYQIDFGNVFNLAFENYKKIALYAGLMIFVFSVILGLLAGGIVILGILLSIFDVAALKELTESMKPENIKPEMFSVNFILINLAITVVVNCLISPFPAGLIKMAHYAEKDEEFHVSTIFEYFKAPYFKELIIATFVITMFRSGLSTLLEIAHIEFVGVLTTIAIWLLSFLTVPLIIFGNLKAVDAIKSSMIIVSKQPLVLLGLLIVSFIASMVGFIGCCIGVFFTIPFMYSMYYAIYASIIGIDSDTELE